MEFVVFLALWALLCAPIVPLAKRRRRSPMGWFWIAFATTPVTAAVLLLAMLPVEPKPK